MDEQGIRDVIKVYFDTGYDADEGIAETMHDDALLYSFEKDGSLRIWNKETFVKIATSMGHGYPRFEEITAIDFTGEDTAVARVKVRVEDILFTDILSFMRLDGRWWIVAKVFYGVPIEA